MLWLVNKNQDERKMSLFRSSKYLVLIGLILLAVSGSFSESTGKIAGKVTAAKTGEGLPGSLVVIIETKISASANLDGSFAIENVPEGSYDIKAQMLGFKDMVKNKVQVNQGQTTLQDFALDQAIIPIDRPYGKGVQQVILTGRISGKVTDAKNGEGLHNAYLEIVGIKLVKLADSGGNYHFNVRPGTYVLCAEKTGFKRSEMVEVTVVKGKTTVRDFKLEP